jgi:hypothetical protein
MQGLRDENLATVLQIAVTRIWGRPMRKVGRKAVFSGQMAVLLAGLSALSGAAHAQQAATDNLDLTMVLLPEDARSADVITRRIELPAAAAERGAGRGEDGRGNADRARQRREDRPGNAGEARQPGGDGRSNAREARELGQDARGNADAAREQGEIGRQDAAEARGRGRDFGQEVAEQARENRENAGRGNGPPERPDQPGPPDNPPGNPPGTPPGNPPGNAPAPPLS